jgi:hypothetical protein
MRTVKVASTAAATSWVVDRDCVLVAVQLASSTTNRVLVSNDPAATVAEIESPSSTYIAETLAVYAKVLVGSNGQTIPLPTLNIPLQGGSTLYFSFSTVASAILFLEEPSSAEI